MIKKSLRFKFNKNMKKTRAQLEAVEKAVKRVYNRPGRKMREIMDQPYNPDDGAPLGYSWMYNDKESGDQVLTIFVADLGVDKEETKYRIACHEYGHGYCGHLDSDQYEELDRRILDVFKNYRGQIIDLVNEECGVDFGEDLVNRVLDDPSLNHELHNIAMDMEVNSKILSNEDIDEMEKDITDLMPKLLEQKLGDLKDTEKDPKRKKEIEDALDKLSKESKIKLILPCRYHDKNGNPFPDGLSYPEYMMLIIRNLSQFVKMLVSIANGGNGDTSGISAGDISNALGGGGMQSLDDLMKSMGMADNGDGDGEGQAQSGGEGDGDGQADGIPPHDPSSSGGYKGSADKRESEHRGVRSKDDGFNLDHRSPSRDAADKAREAGDIDAGGGYGCGNSGGPDMIRNVKKVDPVDEAIDEVIRNTKSRVIKRKITRNIIRNYNLGKNRSVIAPSIIAKNRIDTKPKLVFIIDVSGSMDTGLIDRIISTIARKMKTINRGLRYDILGWSHAKGDWLKDLDPSKPVPKIRYGGGTCMADALRFVKENYDESINFVLCSDFEDHLQEWCNVLKNMPNYYGYGFNYGCRNYNQEWPQNFKVKNFNVSYVGGRRSW